MTTKRSIERQAAHDEQAARLEAEMSAPLTKQAAFSICRSVYGATGCACEKRPDMSVCSSMARAALSVIRTVRTHEQGPPPMAEMSETFKRIEVGLKEALAVAKGDLRAIEGIRVHPSCGCVFCDVGLEPHEDGIHRAHGHEVACLRTVEQ